MKQATHKPMALFAFVALLATPPAAIHHSKIYRGIASEEASQEIEVADKLPQPELPMLSRRDIKVENNVIEDLDAQALKLPQEKLPDLSASEIKVAEPEARDFQIKESELTRVKLPELERGDIQVAHPRFDKLAEKVLEKKTNEDLELSVKKFKEKSLKLQEDVAKLKEEKSDKKGDKIEDLAIGLLLIEGSLKDLKEKKVLSEKEQKAAALLIYDAKNDLELLLMAQEKPEKASEEKVAKKEVSEKVEEVKKEKSEVTCEANDKTSLLTKQVQDLVDNQNKIMQSMLSMTQMMMMNMMMQQQKQQQQPVPYQYPNQYAYQYQQPQTAGNWVYYPQGFQPSQSNIFSSSPQLTQYQGSFYPDQAHQQSNWSMQPSMNFNNQSMQAPQAPMGFNTSSMVTPGTFGGSGVSFNLSNTVPTVSQNR